MFLSFLVALLITTACAPLLLRWAPRLGLTDLPGPRKVHATAVPRVGGIAMAAGILVPGLLIPHLTPTTLGLLVGLVVLLVFGVWDDRVNLDYRLKFLGQFLAVGLCMLIGGVRIASLTFNTAVELPPAASIGLTFVFLVGVTNAVNLSDGLDGLAGGLAFLCLCAIAVFGATTGNWPVTTVALIECGAILGFLRFNTHPARIFMGDGGSQMLGFSIGVLAILATQGESSVLSASLPLLILGLPILDTLTAIVRRLAAGQSPFVSDRNHLHHHLLGLGFAHPEAVVIVYCVQIVLFLCAYFLRFQSDVLIVTVYGVFAALLLALLTWAKHAYWRAHSARTSRLRAALENLREPAHAAALARLASWATCAGLVGYAALVVAANRHVGSDIGVLSAALLVLLLVLSRFTDAGPLGWLERLTAYLSVILLVYLDETAQTRGAGYAWLAWGVIAITAAAALAGFGFSGRRRFEVTALDVLVVFAALVIPNLPGFVSLPPYLPAGIVKAVVLLYVVEMFEGLGVSRRLPRALVALLLGAIALKGLPLLAA